MDMPADRRQFLKGAAMGAPALWAAQAEAASGPAAAASTPLLPGSIPIADLPRHYDVEPGVHNLENGYWGIMPRVVAQEYV
ncbi:hypothetical protein ACTGU6_11140, partial [Streptococcus suis]